MHENSETFGEAEKATFISLMEQTLTPSAAALTDLLGRNTECIPISAAMVACEVFGKDYPKPQVVGKMKFSEGIIGINWFILKDKDAAIIADLMMGNDGSNPPEELTELQFSAIAEVLSQLMTTTAAKLSTLIRAKLAVINPQAERQSFSDPYGIGEIFGSNTFVRAIYKFTVEGLINSEITHLMPIDFAKQLVANAEGKVSAQAPSAVKAQQVPAPAGAGMPAVQTSVPAYTPPGVIVAQATPQVGTPVAQPVQFTPLIPGVAPTQTTNVDLLLDVPLQVTVELGRASKQVKDILALGPGSIVQLDKLAGEPVDVLINEKLVAKGEVVVIDESFGVRITNIVSPHERISSLQ